MKNPDAILLLSAAMLIVFGLIMVASASSVISQDRFGHPYGYLMHQAIFGLGVGMAGFFIGYRIDYKNWQKLAPLLLLVTLALLALVFVPQTGFGYGGARRWIRLGYLSLQPSEILKLTLVFYLAAWLSRRRRELQSAAEGPIPFLIMLAAVGGLLVIQPDIGTLGVVMATGAVMFFVAGGAIRHLIMMAAFVIAAVGALIMAAPYRIDRLTTFLHPEADPQGIGYQLRQSLIAIGSGGATGLGIGYSRQKHYYVPETFGDSIFAILAEETGFAGVTVFIGVLGVFLSRCLTIAKRAPDDFGRLLAVGMAAWIGVQSFINIGAASGLVPLTGIPLPFVSYGGTSLALLLTGAGVLANISIHGRKT